MRLLLLVRFCLFCGDGGSSDLVGCFFVCLFSFCHFLGLLVSYVGFFYFGRVSVVWAWWCLGVWVGFGVCFVVFVCFFCVFFFFLVFGCFLFLVCAVFLVFCFCLLFLLGLLFESVVFGGLDLRLVGWSGFLFLFVLAFSVFLLLWVVGCFSFLWESPGSRFCFCVLVFFDCLVLFYVVLLWVVVFFVLCLFFGVAGLVFFCSLWPCSFGCCCGCSGGFCFCFFRFPVWRIFLGGLLFLFCCVDFVSLFGIVCRCVAAVSFLWVCCCGSSLCCSGRPVFMGLGVSLPPASLSFFPLFSFFYCCFVLDSVFVLKF